MFAQRLKSLRSTCGISQKELAARLFVSQQTVAKWETERATPNPDMLNKLADILDTSADYLLGRTDEKKPTSEEIGFDDFTYAMQNESGNLSEEDKQLLLSMAPRMAKDAADRERETKG